MKKLIMFLTVFAASLSVQATSCDIEQTSNGQYGVREHRASGWVYIVRGLTYEEAVRALSRLQAGGRCD